MIEAAIVHASAAQLRDQILRGRRSAAETMSQRAVARGELSAEVVTLRLTSLSFDLFRHEVMMTHQPDYSARA